MVLLPIKMPIFISIMRFLVLLTIIQFCETLSDNSAWRYTGHRNKNVLLDQIDIFGEDGSIQIEVPGNHYVMIGNKIFLEGSTNESDVQSTTFIPIGVQKVHSHNGAAGMTGANTISNLTWDENDELDYVSDLTVLSLETERLYNLSSDTFSWLSSTSIQLLNMRYMDIEAVAEDTLKPVQTTLMILDLSHSNISTIDINALVQGLREDGRGSHCSILIALSLANLGLNRIPYKVLTHVQYSLRGLTLSGNNFETYFATTMDIFVSADAQGNQSYSEEKLTKNYFSNLLAEEPDNFSPSPWGDFPEMPFLVSLDMRWCNINYIERGLFRNLTNLKKLYLSGNNILFLQNFLFERLFNLAYLDISRNGNLKDNSKFRGLIISTNSFGELYSLQTLNLSYTLIHGSTVTRLSGLPDSLINLYLRGSRISSLESGIFRQLNKLQILDLSGNRVIASDVSTETFMGLTMLQELYMAGTSLQSFEPLKELSTLKLLDVHDNNIASFENLLENFPLLEHLDVSFNYINAWKDNRAFERNSRLKGVFLHSNMLSLMSEVMQEDFKSLSYLTLGDNNFVCNCYLKSFMEYLISLNDGTTKNMAILIDYEPKSKNHVCTDITVSRTFPFAATDQFCIDDRTRILLSALQHVIYISLLVTISSVSAGALIYWKWWYIRYVAVLLKNATVLSIINVENCEDRVYMYDIFVSYSDQNRNWVVEELLPNIEGPEARLNICLHERDFQVGVSILENIIMGMDQSRTILLIISGCFMKSQWCQFEMHLAQHRLLETCREELVLVLLEEIPRRNRTKILHYLMMVKTYIVWPKDSNDVTAKKLFWRRLRRAITANKSKHPLVV